MAPYYIYLFWLHGRGPPLTTDFSNWQNWIQLVVIYISLSLFLFIYMFMYLRQVKVHISKQIPYLDSLNTLVLESIKILWESIFYFSMRIKNSDHRREPFVYISDFFEDVKVKFFCFISKQIPYLVSLNSLVLESIKILCGNQYFIFL